MLWLCSYHSNDVARHEILPGVNDAPLVLSANHTHVPRHRHLLDLIRRRLEADPQRVSFEFMLSVYGPSHIPAPTGPCKVVQAKDLATSRKVGNLI